MSCWLLSAKHYQVIHNGLIRRGDKLVYLETEELIGEKNITKFVRSLAKLNAESYNDRYDGKRVGAPRFSTEIKYIPTDAQLYKALSCVCYQLSNNSANYKKLVVLTQQIRYMLSADPFTNTIAHAEAPWAIEHNTEIPESRLIPNAKPVRVR